MKRNLYVALTALVLALAVTIPLVNAQSPTKADIPFSFTIAESAMPAGTYTITAVGQYDMVVRNVDTNAAIIVLVHSAEKLDPQSPRLVFHKYGDRYFLAEAWTGAGGQGIEFPSGKPEQEVRTAYQYTGGGPSEAVVALR